MGKIYIFNTPPPVYSDDMTAFRSDVLKGKTTITNDSDDEIVAGTLELTGNAANSDVLSGKTYYNTDAKTKQTGSMANRGAVSQALNAGGSYTIPSGYHNGSGKVTANALSGQTAGTANAGQILSGQTAWVNGSKLSGTMVNHGSWANGTSCTIYENKLYTRFPGGYYGGGNWDNGAAQAETPIGQDKVAAAISLTAGKIAKNQTIIGIAGTYTSDANSGAGDIRSGKTAYVNGSKLTGTLAVQSALSFSAAALSFNTIRISWKNPSKGPWQGVFIQMSTSGYPGTGGGSRVYTGAGNNPNQANGNNYVDIGGLNPGTTYYFTCTSYCDALGWGSSYNINVATSVGLSIGQMLSAGYFVKYYPLVYNAFWTQHDSDPSYGYNVFYVNESNNQNGYGENAMFGGVFYGPSDAGVARLADVSFPGHTTFLLFAGSNNTANTAVACIRSRYSKIRFEGRSKNNFSTIVSSLTREFTIKSVINKGLVETANYGLKYGAPNIYWYPNENSFLRDKYLVEITTNETTIGRQIVEDDYGRYYLVYFYS